MREAGKYYPPTPVEVFERAWELYANHSWREVARILTREGHPVSHEQARQWGQKGRDILMAKDDLDPHAQRFRSAEWLEQWMGRLAKLADELDSESEITLLDVLNQFKWMFRERAKLLGTDAPTRTQVSLDTEAVEPQEWIQRAVFKDPEEDFGHR